MFLRHHLLFDQVPPPDFQSRCQIIRLQLARQTHTLTDDTGSDPVLFEYNVKKDIVIHTPLITGLNMSPEQPLMRESNVCELARRTLGYSGADLTSVGVEAGMQALRRGIDTQHVVLFYCHEI